VVPACLSNAPTFVIGRFGPEADVGKRPLPAKNSQSLQPKPTVIFIRRSLSNDHVPTSFVHSTDAHSPEFLYD